MNYVQWLRLRVGHKKVFLAFASVVLRDSQGRILLQRRTDFNVWGLPGGSLEPGEDIFACARRELLEETGLTCGDLRLAGVYTDPRYDVTYPNGDQVQQYTVCFSSTLDGGEMRADGVENSDQAFFAPESIPAQRMPTYYAAMIEAALSTGGPAFSPPVRQDRLRDQFQVLPRSAADEAYIGVGAVAVCARADGKVLALRSSELDPWRFPWGWMQFGENVAHTAQRVAAEQAGLRVMPQRILGVHSPPTACCLEQGLAVQPVMTIFHCQVEGEAEGRLPPGAAWLPQEQRV